MNIKADTKVTVLSDTLKEFIGDRMNLASINFSDLIISTLCKMQTVCFEKSSCSFECDGKAESSLRRIRRFISEFSLEDVKYVCKLMSLVLIALVSVY